MIKCPCGREFISDKAFNAHKFYCNEYVATLDPLEQHMISERKHKKSEKTKHAQNKRLEAFLSEGRTCQECGNPITCLDRNARYCSKHCASKAKYREFSDSQKLKMQQNSTLVRKQNIVEQKKLKDKLFASEYHTCKQCGKVMDHIYASGRFCSISCSKLYCKEYNQSKQRREECSDKLKSLWRTDDYRKSILASQKQARDEGRWSKMMSSSRKSYPELFWQETLRNLNIRYEYNYLVKHSDLHMSGRKLSWYKFDFYLLDYNVDLEIDGDQHKESKIRHADEIRDFNIHRGGYLVYRIPWSNIESDRYDSICRFLYYLWELDTEQEFRALYL